MEDELVDIVDKNGAIIRSDLKSKAHKSGALHKTVIGEVRNSKGRWVLIKQAAHKQDAGQYVSPVGGHVKAGETEDEALKREVFEEIGLEEFKYEFVGRKIFNRKVLGRHENHFFVVFKLTSDEDFNLSDEAVSYKTFTEDELRKEINSNPKGFGGAFFFVIKNFYPNLLQE